MVDMLANPLTDPLISESKIFGAAYPSIGGRPITIILLRQHFKQNFDR